MTEFHLDQNEVNKFYKSTNTHKYTCSQNSKNDFSQSSCHHHAIVTSNRSSSWCRNHTDGRNLITKVLLHVYTCDFLELETKVAHKEQKTEKELDGLQRQKYGPIVPVLE